MKNIILLLIFVACASGCGQSTDSPTQTTDTQPAKTNVAESNDSSTASDSKDGEQANGTDASSTAAEAGSASKANADVTNVLALAGKNGWTFQVTVDHPDTGWKDYADGWDVVLPDGTVVKPDPDSPFTRLLAHPHENERPFVRDQSGIVIPADVTTVTVRAHDLVAGFGGREVVVDLSSSKGEGFSVER